MQYIKLDFFPHNMQTIIIFWILSSYCCLIIYTVSFTNDTYLLSLPASTLNTTIMEISPKQTHTTMHKYEKIHCLCGYFDSFESENERLKCNRATVLLVLIWATTPYIFIENQEQFISALRICVFLCLFALLSMTMK